MRIPIECFQNYLWIELNAPHNPMQRTLIGALSEKKNMSILDIFRSLKRRFSKRRLDEWYLVVSDNISVSLDVSPSGKEPWKDTFKWDSVVRICFKDEGLYFSDTYYVYTSNREESYVIPAEASGGQEFVEKMLDLKMFDEQYFIEAMGSTNGGYYCWPKHDQDE